MQLHFMKQIHLYPHSITSKWLVFFNAFLLSMFDYQRVWLSNFHNRSSILVTSNYNSSMLMSYDWPSSNYGDFVVTSWDFAKLIYKYSHYRMYVRYIELVGFKTSKYHGVSRTWPAKNGSKL